LYSGVDDEGVGGVEARGEAGQTSRARVVVAGVLRGRRRQGQRDVVVGQVDHVDAEAAVGGGLLGDPGGDDRAEPALADAADDDGQGRGGRVRGGAGAGRGGFGRGGFGHGATLAPRWAGSQTGPRLAVPGPP